MKWLGIILTAIFIFMMGVQVGEHLVLHAIKQVCGEYHVPTRGEGFRSKRPTKERYSEQTRRLK